MAAADRQLSSSTARRTAPPAPRRVLLPLPLTGAYDYRAASGAGLERAGDFVVVPLGSRDVTGVVWGEALGEVAELKTEGCRPDGSRRRRCRRLCDFVDWVAAYTCRRRAPCCAWR